MCYVLMFFLDEDNSIVALQRCASTVNPRRLRLNAWPFSLLWIHEIVVAPCAFPVTGGSSASSVAGAAPLSSMEWAKLAHAK